MRKSTKLLLTLLTCVAAAAITSCNSGTTTNTITVPEICPYPAFTTATAENLLTSWGQGLQYYQNHPTESDVFVNAANFTMSFYTPDAILQPTVESIQKVGTQAIYGYFTNFLPNTPVMSVEDPSLNIAAQLGCGFGAYAGYYTFVLNESQAQTVQARFTFVYQYKPAVYSENATIESGAESGTVVTQQNQPGWYIFRQQSSVLPDGTAARMAITTQQLDEDASKLIKR